MFYLNSKKIMPIKLSIIIPCYNEQNRFNEGVSHFLNYLRKQKYSWEIILVNDGSKDKTPQLMDALSKTNERIRTISYKINKGKGHAIKVGAQKARGKFILFSDLDHSVPVDTVESFFGYFDKGYDVVIGSRRVEGSEFIKHQKFLRESLGRGFTFLVRILVDWPIKDATCGFKAFTRKAAKKLFSKISIYGWAFDAEILFLCKKYGYKYAQAPVSWQDAKGSKVSISKDILVSLISLIKIRINDCNKKYS